MPNKNVTPFKIAAQEMGKEVSRVRRQKLDITDPRAFRLALGLNQMDFWRLFGATQSGGCRYELGRSMPCATAMLLQLFASGQLTAEQIDKAKREVIRQRDLAGQVKRKVSSKKNAR